MKQILPLRLRTALNLAVFQLGLILCSSVDAAVTFTMTPAAVSNTYNGRITLQVTGLTSGDTVVVQKFLDLNTNGVIDAGDWLVQQFNLTDGQAGMVIGGVTNFNVPEDINTTAGQITAKLNFQNGDFIQQIAGQYVFRLSSPSGHFVPITSLFSVTNLPYTQKFSGNVVSNGTSTTLPNAVVLLFPPPRPGKNGPGGSPLASAVANNSGGYSIPAPPGTYTPVAFKNGYVVDFSAPPIITLGSGKTINTNLTVLNATSTISGKLVDASNASIGLPGILMSVQSANGLLGVGYTDTNGNFTSSVQASAGQWALRAEDTSLVIHGYLGLQNRTKASAGQTGVTLTVPKATALVYGSVKDSLGNPLPGYDIYGNDNNSYLYQTDAYSDVNGNYVAAVLGGLGPNDPWWLSVSTDTGPTGYIFSQPTFDQNGGTNISAGTAVQANFTALLATNYITGNVKANGTNLPVVGVYAYATINNVDFNVSSDTDINGNYSLNVGNGTWSVSVNCGGGNDGLDNLLGNGSYQCPANQNVTINNNAGSANFTVQLCNGVQILTTNLPNGQVGSFFGFTLQGSGCGGGPLNWSLNDPQDFPSSLGFGGDGSIQGTPNSSGTYNFTVSANDGNGHSSSQNLSLYIAPPSTPLQIVTMSLPSGTNGSPYSQTIQASGGQPPYSWFIPGYSALPPQNLILGSNGVLAGTLTTSGGPFYFDVAVTDAASNIVYQTLSLFISSPPPPPLQITSVSLPNGTVGSFYNSQLGATGGQPPYNWSLALGSASLPPGLILNPAGLISGIPGTNGLSSFKVHVSDSNSSALDKIFSITINPKPVLVLGSPNWLANQFQMQLTGVAGQNYTVEMSTDLSASWTSLFVTNSATTNSFNVIDHTASDKQRFYRVKVGP
ncbi:MAG TPA: putative Ig domain-containing protein [Verrucomicrobiae bacterium]|nr:putative Ig domain-containing protein [Verrucomicrobiae bacterium]